MIRRLIPSLLAILALVLFANLASQAQQLPSPGSEEWATRETWRASMRQTPLPEKGCFKASYPATEWKKVACTTAPPYPTLSHPTLPGRGQAKSNTVGGGYNDFVGVVTTGLLSQAEGSFPFSTGLATSDAYSLQLNSNFFPGGPGGTPACNGAANPAFCYGWQQFLYESSGSIYMVYWLLNWGTTCPSGWTEKTVSGEIDCYEDSSATSTSSQAISNLPYITLTAKASGGTDTVLMDSLYGDISAVGQDSVLDLEEGWSRAEFNVFGNGNDAEVYLDSNAALVVQISLDNGTSDTPTYSTGGTTGESNNLTLTQAAPCMYGGTTPMIQFMESNASAATASCGGTGIETNIAQTPSDTAIYSRYPETGPPSYVNYSITLADGTPGAEIYYVIDYCQEQLGGSGKPGDNFNLRLTGVYMSCYPSGTMFATAPGYLESQSATMFF